MIPNELAEQFARGNGTLFIGAGMSKGADLPDWRGLIDPLRAEIDGCPDGASLLDVAQYFANGSSRANLLGKLRSSLRDRRFVPSKAHHALLSLPVRRIYTTNFDDLLDQTFDLNKVDYDPIRKTVDLSVVRPQVTQLIKLHGDLYDPETIVVTASDYEAYLSNKPALARLIASELQTKTVLFIGYSFNDHDLRMIMTQVGAEAAKLPRNLYTIQNKPTAAVTKDLDLRGLKVISLDLGAHRPLALSDWLDEFARSIRSHGVPIGNIPRITAINIQSPPIENDLVGRERELKRALEGLHSRYPVVAIEGDPGVGKRRLALETTRFCNGHNRIEGTERLVFEFITWLGPKASPKTSWLEEALNAVAIVTGNTVTAQRPPEQLAEKKTEVQKILRSYKVLLVIDGYEGVGDPELEQWILEEVPYPSKVLLTSIAPVRQAWPVPMAGLSEADSLCLLRQFAREMDLAPVKRASDRELLPLIQRTQGNPQALRLALGIVKGGAESLRKWETHANYEAKQTEELMETFFDWSWSLLTLDAQEILLALCVFPYTGTDTGAVGMEALQYAAERHGNAFHEALDQLLSFHLVESRSTGGHGTARYSVHAVVRQLVRLKLNQQPALEAEMRERCARYYLDFVRRMTQRQAPATRYWTSLVTSRMNGIDGEWVSIDEAIRWALEEKKDDLFLDFVMHLVHYMDSRFLNRERTEYVHQAVDMLRALDRKEDEALLRIDSLGWTYVEEGDTKRACEEIEIGVRLLDQLEESAPESARLECKGLRALASAWNARAACGQGDIDKALELIKPALAVVSEPWVNARVLMVAGDIEFSALRYDPALQFYRQCATQMESYGGEGDGYQTDPRIGLAYLSLGKLPEAEEKFNHLRKNDVIKVGVFYADYGLALVKCKQGLITVQGAREIGKDIELQLLKRTRSNLLIGLIDKFNHELESESSGATTRQQHHQDVVVVDAPSQVSIN